MGRFLTRAAAWSLTFYLLFGQRVTIDAGTEGRSALSLPEALFLVVSAVLWAGLKLGAQRPRLKGILPMTVGPLFALLLILPFIGVLIGDYELRALYSFVVVLVPASILVLCAAAKRWNYDLRGPVFVAIVAQGIYGLGQLLLRVGVVPANLGTWALNWDANSQAVYSESYVISSRSTGLFLNPNEFGLWSVLAILFGALYLTGRRQSVAVVFGLLGVFASQSRTAWLALGLFVVLYLGSFAVRPRRASKSLVSLVAGMVVVVIMSLMGVFPKLLESGAVSRFNTGLSALTGGGAAGDLNLESRYVGWARANEFVQDYVIGTLGPPQVKFGSSIDNQFVTYYLQGGALLVLAYALALVSPFVFIRRRVPQSWKLMIVSVTIAIYSYTSNPMDSQMASALAWVCAGLTVQLAAGRDRPARPVPEGVPAPGVAGARHPSLTLPTGGRA